MPSWFFFNSCARFGASAAAMQHRVLIPAMPHAKDVDFVPDSDTDTDSDAEDQDELKGRVDYAAP